MPAAPSVLPYFPSLFMPPPLLHLFLSLYFFSSKITLVLDLGKEVEEGKRNFRICPLLPLGVS